MNLYNSQKKYFKNNIKQLKINLSPKDEDIILKLSKIDNKSKYIKNLIRKG